MNVEHIASKISVFFFKFFYGLFVPISIDVKSLGKNTMNRHIDEIQSVDFMVTPKSVLFLVYSMTEKTKFLGSCFPR